MIVNTGIPNPFPILTKLRIFRLNTMLILADPIILAIVVHSTLGFTASVFTGIWFFWFHTMFIAANPIPLAIIVYGTLRFTTAFCAGIFWDIDLTQVISAHKSHPTLTICVTDIITDTSPITEGIIVTVLIAVTPLFRIASANDG